eukprot:4432486-Pyramimonas_sp.AAC.1
MGRGVGRFPPRTFIFQLRQIPVHGRQLAELVLAQAAGGGWPAARKHATGREIPAACRRCGGGPETPTRRS